MVGNDEEEEDEIVINHHDPAVSLQGEDIPFTSDFSANLTPPLANRSTMVQFEEERPDTGMEVYNSLNKLCQLIETISAKFLLKIPIQNPGCRF